jgi:hypothetical protein
MSASWSALGVEGQRFAARHFAEREAADELLVMSEPQTRRPTFTDLYAWATDPEHAFGSAEREALLRDPVLRRSFTLLVGRLASLRVPAAAAASSGRLDARSGQGVSVRLVPSRADPKQVYVLLEIERDVQASLLLVLRDGVPVARLALPETPDGHLQVIEANDSPLVGALRDPATELVLM